MSFFVTNNFILSCSNSCYVTINTVNNYSYNLLLDTGASISAIQYKHIIDQNIPFHKSNLVVSGLGGNLIAIGYVYLNLLIGDQILSHQFYVFDSLPCKASGILGHDFFNKYCAILNYNTCSLSLWNQGVMMNVRVKMGNNSLNIPARSESIHFIYTNMTEECVVSASEIQDGIFIASTLVKPTDGQIPIRILNTTEQDLQLKINNFKPIIFLARDFDICSFDKPTKNSERVKRLLSILQLDHLNKEEKSSILSICAKYNDVFFMQGDKLTTTKLYKHSITLKPNTVSVYSKPYRLPHSQKGEIQKQIDDLLQQGIIEPCNSEWSSPVLLVPKRSEGEKKWRLVIDYRKLNNCILDDKFPLPHNNDILDSLSGCVYFSHLDLNQGFYNVELEESSRKYTAFSSGQYQMTRMPMGLKTSPSSFSRMMSMAMAGLTYDKCLCYLDDLIIMGRNLHDHNKNLIDVLERIRNLNLKLNPSKCDFLKRELLYLGHVVSSEGVLPDPEKIYIIKNYPVPQNVDDTRRFVALANFYRKFIPKFAEIAYPLNALCRKNIKFNWDKNCQKSFETLKQCIMSPPVLQYPDLSDKNQFIVQTDASGYAIGAILSNSDNRPVAFASRTLNKAEKNYPTIEKELLAIVWAVKHFRPYLYGRTFKIITDHKPLIYLFNMKDPSSRLLKFRLVLEEYDYVIEYVKGKENAAADALSRVIVTSKELKEMNECVFVMTRAQRRRMEGANMNGERCESNSLNNNNNTDNTWPDQPRVVDTHNKPKTAVELRFIDKYNLNILRRRNKIKLENNIFSYDTAHFNLYINPASQS